MTAVASQPDQTSKKNPKNHARRLFINRVLFSTHKNWSLNNNNKIKGGNITNILEPDLFRVRNRKKKKSPAWQEMAARLQIDQLRTGSQLTLHLSPYPTLFCFSKQKTKQRKITFSFGEWALLCGVCEPGIFYYLLFYFILAPLGHGRWCPKVTVTCSSQLLFKCGLGLGRYFRLLHLRTYTINQ